MTVIEWAIVIAIAISFLAVLFYVLKDVFANRRYYVEKSRNVRQFKKKKPNNRRP
ncbi:hypothetical protein ACR6HW_10405 [Fusibacter sp. JL298sf-3]